MTTNSLQANYSYTLVAVAIELTHVTGQTSYAGPPVEARGQQDLHLSLMLYGGPDDVGSVSRPSISNDANPSKKAWAESLGGISYEMLSDYHPHGAVARAYGVLRDDGLAERAIVVIDRAGMVRWTRLYDIPDQPDVEELLTALKTL